MTQNQEQQKIQTAIMQGLNEYKGVKLPSPQTTGTSTQQQSYAWQAAERVLKQLTQ